jgi:hypothetical protein
MVEPVGLPDSSFIMLNLPAVRPVSPSIATKTGKAAIGKRNGTTSTVQKGENAKKTKKTKKPV